MMGDKPEELAARIVGITKGTCDQILSGDRPAEVLALYSFLTYTATWQETNQPYATIEFCAKGLAMSRDRTRKAKQILVSYGLVEDVRATDSKTGRAKKWYVRLPKKLKQATLLKANRVEAHTETHPTDLPQGGESATNAYRKISKCLQKEQKELRHGKSAREVLRVPSWEEVREYGRSQKPKIPVETIKAFFILNSDNDWKTTYNKRRVPIRDWKMALDRFAKTDRKRVTAKKSPITNKEFWEFVKAMDANPVDAELAADTWVRFMEKRDWKIPDKVTGTLMPLQDPRRVFEAWYRTNWINDDGLNRPNWGDVNVE